MHHNRNQQDKLHTFAIHIWEEPNSILEEQEKNEENEKEKDEDQDAREARKEEKEEKELVGYGGLLGGKKKKLFSNLQKTVFI